MKLNDVFQKPYRLWFFCIFFLYLLLNVLFSGFYNTIPLIIQYAATVDWFSLTLSVLFALAIGFFIAVNSILLFIRYKQRKNCSKAGTLTGVGTVGGFITGVCPLCISGLFPLLFSFFGISLSLGNLPFKGIEVQILTLLVLVLSFFLLTRRT
ncbi:MAG: hypothetical protein Q8L34_03615 [Candidatus Woesearchaeota archaeon]|nr:hypothetical protein [Candidatus Woesearchaeota archaeon]